MESRQLTLLGSFASGSVAGMLAATVTNPMEVVKTRLQLDGEGVKQGTHTRQYRGILHACKAIASQEGLKGIQAGLGPALFYQMAMNGSRLGFYVPIQNAIVSALAHPRIGVDIDKHSPFLKMCAGAASGVIGVVLGNPLYLVKNRLQAQSVLFKVKEGYTYTGAIDGLQQVFRAEGVRGWYRGLSAAVPRVVVGSATQLSSYDYAKVHFVESWMNISPGLNQQIAASILASLATVTLMNPFDVIATRMFQSSGRNTSYNGVLDCASKTVQMEGLLALQKGWSALFFRLGPMSVLSLVLMEQVGAKLKQQAQFSTISR